MEWFGFFTQRCTGVWTGGFGFVWGSDESRRSRVSAGEDPSGGRMLRVFARVDRSRVFAIARKVDEVPRVGSCG